MDLEGSSAESNPLRDPSVRDRLADLPPSAKLVALVLNREAPTSVDTLAEESCLPPRTVRAALTQLEDADLVRSRPDIRDARRLIYAPSGAVSRLTPFAPDNE
jgi:DNA-binding MarR family transcriptional regulator